MTFAWRCWGLLREPGHLASMLDPWPPDHIVRWSPGAQASACAFHDHASPDKDCRCGWRGQPDLKELLWWLADFKRVMPYVIGGVHLSGEIIQGDKAHPEIPRILRAEHAEVSGPLVVAPGLDWDHVDALSARYGVKVALSRSVDPACWARTAHLDLADAGLSALDAVPPTQQASALQASRS
jgi:hypothetical protein